MKFSLLVSVLLPTSSSVLAYFADANNAHVEFVSLSSSSSSSSTLGSDTDNGVDVNVVDGGKDDVLTYEEQWKIHAHSVLQMKFDSWLSNSNNGDAPTLAAAATTTTADDIIRLFEEWALKFNVEYEPLYERGNKLLVWFENHVMIETHNAHAQMGLSSFYLGHNEYSDLTHYEFRQVMKLGEFARPELVLGVGEKKEFKFALLEEEEAAMSNTNNLRGPSMETVPATAIERKLSWSSSSDDDEVDWHTKGLLGPIRNQGICGACWAFAAIGSIESAMAIDKYNQMEPTEREKLVVHLKNGSDLGLVIPLSEQNLIDCDTRLEKGCEGGLMTTTFDEEEVKNGICSEADYPYIATEGTCSASMCTPVSGSIVHDHVDIPPRKTKALMEALKVKPVTAAMVATDPMLQFYSSGIYDSDYGKVTKEMDDPQCMRLYEGQDVCLPDINHGVLVVGYGKDDTTTTDNKLFFKIKNSWGDSWGEGGYFRLARKETDPADPLTNWGECGILTLLSYPVMEKV